MTGAQMEVYKLECIPSDEGGVEFRFYLRGEVRGDIIPTLILIGSAIQTAGVEKVARSIVGSTYDGPDEFLNALTAVGINECRNINQVMMTISSPPC